MYMLLCVSTCFLVAAQITVPDSSVPKALHKQVGVDGGVAGFEPATPPSTPTQASRRRRRDPKTLVGELWDFYPTPTQAT